ncbi:MAG: LysR family transcriptional regulator [Burkholderiaceae bacterium]
MNEIDIRRIDLNLLVVFDVLMRERHVSRAADRLARTQSAVSHALARLRTQLDDPLLVNSGGRMSATPFAEHVHERVVPLLAGLAAALQPQPRFEPRSSSRDFRFAAPDFAASLVLPLQRALFDAAPGASLTCLPEGTRTLAGLAVGAIDLAMVPASLTISDDLAEQAVGEVAWGCFARAGHPAWRRWGRRSWAAYPHLVVQTGDGLPSMVEQVAGRLRLARRVAMRVGVFSMVAPLLANSDLIATLPRLVMLDSGGRYGLESRRVPFPIPGIAHKLVWGRRMGSDPAVRWFRDLVADTLASSLQAHAPR